MFNNIAMVIRSLGYYPNKKKLTYTVLLTARVYNYAIRAQTCGRPNLIWSPYLFSSLINLIVNYILYITACGGDDCNYKRVFIILLRLIYYTSYVRQLSTKKKIILILITPPIRSQSCIVKNYIILLQVDSHDFARVT